MDRKLYDELAGYTLTYQDPAFIHQYIVDAYAAQNATEQTKPITITFALIGLYLHVEKNYTGKKVQWVHMLLGKRKYQWPKFELPENRGEITIEDVLKIPPGSARDLEIDKWCVSVWQAFKSSHQTVKDLLEKELN